MGMVTRIVGYREPDEEWEKMANVWRACEAAGVPVPQKVYDFFGGIAPDGLGAGQEVDIEDAVRDWENGMSAGFVVKIAKLPPHTTHIRFYNSW